MDSFLSGLLILSVSILGIVVTLIFILVAIFKQSSRSWKRAGYSLLAFGTIVTGLFLYHKLILFPPNPKVDQLVFSAYREAPIGGIWLGLFDDKTWELGYSSVEITSSGTFDISGDTLKLIATEGTTVIKEFKQTSFIMKPDYLLELKNTGIRSLIIQMNEIEKNGL